MGWAVMMSMKQAVDGPDWKISPAGKIDIEHADLYRWDVDFLTGPAWVRFCRPISPKSIQEQWNRLDYRFCIKKKRKWMEWILLYWSLELSFLFYFPFLFSFLNRTWPCFIVSFTLKGSALYKMDIMLYWRRIEIAYWDHKVFIKVINQVRNKVIFPMDFYIIWLLLESRRSTECTDFIFLT